MSDVKDLEMEPMAKDGVGGHRQFAFDVAIAEILGVDHFSLAHDGDGNTGNFCIVHGPRHDGIKVLERLRSRNRYLCCTKIDPEKQTDEQGHAASPKHYFSFPPKRGGRQASRCKADRQT